MAVQFSDNVPDLTEAGGRRYTDVFALVVKAVQIPSHMPASKLCNSSARLNASRQSAVTVRAWASLARGSLEEGRINLFYDLRRELLDPT